jgi:hypothetical protein
MRYHIEWGIPALDAPPAGRFGSYTCNNLGDAVRLAEHISWVQGAHSWDFSDLKQRHCTRVSHINSAKNFWVCVTKLNGALMGPAYADKKVTGEQ